MARNFEVVDHLAFFRVTDSFYHFRINDDFVPSNKVRDVLSNFVRFVNDIKTRLLYVRNVPLSHLYTEGIFIGLLQQPMTKGVQHFHRTPDDRMSFLFEQNLCASVVQILLLHRSLLFQEPGGEVRDFFSGKQKRIAGWHGGDVEEVAFLDVTGGDIAMGAVG